MKWITDPLVNFLFPTHYRSVLKEKEQLKSQVVGLQDFLKISQLANEHLHQKLIKQDTDFRNNRAVDRIRITTLGKIVVSERKKSNKQIRKGDIIKTVWPDDPQHPKWSNKTYIAKVIGFKNNNKRLEVQFYGETGQGSISRSKAIKISDGSRKHFK
jgi:uncharacterized ubiquitin-like protein YukD